MPCSGRSRRRRARRTPLHGGVEGDAYPRPPGVRAPSSTGVKSAPPPNHHLLVTTMRVFMCAAGTLRVVRMGDERHARGPEARVLFRRRGSACGTPGANSPCTVEVWMPAFSNTRPLIRLHERRRRRRAPLWSVRVHGVRDEAARGSSPKGADAGSSASRRSKARHRSSRSVSNQTARALFRSSSELSEPTVIGLISNSRCRADGNSVWCGRRAVVL